MCQRKLVSRYRDYYDSYDSYVATKFLVRKEGLIMGAFRPTAPGRAIR